MQLERWLGVILTHPMASSHSRESPRHRVRRPVAQSQKRRPPGHHAQGSLCGGYCFFNNAAIAARYLLQRTRTRRIAILDVDYHHGNGSEPRFRSLRAFIPSLSLPQRNKSSTPTRRSFMSHSTPRAITLVGTLLVHRAVVCP